MFFSFWPIFWAWTLFPPVLQVCTFQLSRHALHHCSCFSPHIRKIPEFLFGQVKSSGKLKALVKRIILRSRLIQKGTLEQVICKNALSKWRCFVLETRAQSAINGLQWEKQGLEFQVANSGRAAFTKIDKHIHTRTLSPCKLTLPMHARTRTYTHQNKYTGSKGGAHAGFIASERYH